MRVTGGFHKPMSHERARRDDSLDDARFDQIAKNKPHLANRQGARERHHHKTILVAGHLLKNIGGIADLPPGERRISHGAHQFVDGAAFGQIQREHRPEFVLYWIVEHSPGHSFLSLLRHRFSSTPNQICIVAHFFPRPCEPAWSLSRMTRFGHQGQN